MRSTLVYSVKVVFKQHDNYINESIKHFSIVADCLPVLLMCLWFITQTLECPRYKLGCIFNVVVQSQIAISFNHMHRGTS